MKVFAVIEKGADGLYSIYSEDMLLNHGLGGCGKSVEEAKADFLKSIDEAKAMIAEDGKALPEDAAHIDVAFKYDLQSFFNYFDWINVSQFAKRAGMMKEVLIKKMTKRTNEHNRDAAMLVFGC